MTQLIAKATRQPENQDSRPWDFLQGLQNHGIIQLPCQIAQVRVVLERQCIIGDILASKARAVLFKYLSETEDESGRSHVLVTDANIPGGDSVYLCAWGPVERSDSLVNNWVMRMVRPSLIVNSNGKKVIIAAPLKSFIRE